MRGSRTDGGLHVTQIFPGLGQKPGGPPRPIKGPGDYRPGTTKCKIDAHDIWVVEIKMPKNLMGNMKHGQDEIEPQDAPSTDFGNTDEIS